MLMISSPLSSLFFGEKVEWQESSKILEWPGKHIQPGRLSLCFFPCFTLKTCRDDMSSDGPPRDDMSSTTRKSRILDGGAKKVLLCPGRISFPISRTLSLISGHCPDIGTRKKNEQMHQFCCSAPLLVHCTRVLERFSWVLDGSRVCLIYVSYMGRSQPWDRTAFEHENRRKVQN